MEYPNQLGSVGVCSVHIFVKTAKDMNTVLLKSSSDTDLKLLLALAQKLGMRVHKLSRQQAKDHLLASRIEEGMKTPAVSRDTILKLLES